MVHRHQRINDQTKKIMSKATKVVKAKTKNQNISEDPLRN
jgi:hypothetical protein